MRKRRAAAPTAGLLHSTGTVAGVVSAHPEPLALCPTLWRLVDPATAFDDFGCGIIPADSGLPVFLATQESHVVRAANGNVSLTCHFDIPDGLEPAATMQHSGFLFRTQFGVTTNTRSGTSRGARVLLVCQIKA